MYLAIYVVFVILAQLALKQAGKEVDLMWDI